MLDETPILAENFTIRLPVTRHITFPCRKLVGFSILPRYGSRHGFMDIEDLLAKNKPTDPLQVFIAAKSVDQDRLRLAIRALPYNRFLSTAYWFAVSDRAKIKAGFRCQVCNRKGRIDAHHRSYQNHGSEHEHLEDITVLCRGCHALFHGKIEAPPTPTLPKSINAILAPDPDPQPEQIASVVLTPELLKQCRTAGGGLTNATAIALGVKSFNRGWPKVLIGKTVSAAAFQRAVDGRLIFRRKRSSA